jgi:CheY-like chemotaxis protein
LSLDLNHERFAKSRADRHEDSPRVLIVDDDPINRYVAACACDILGHSCAFACDGAEAVEAVRETHFDLVLMDIRMPGMDGLEATRQIRALGAGGRMPIVAVTADCDPGEVACYRAAGMCAVVSKPVRIQTLMAEIVRALTAVRAAEPRTFAVRHRGLPALRPRSPNRRDPVD